MKDARGHGSSKTNGISVINPNGSNIAKAIAARNAMFGSGYTSAPGVKVNTAWGAANGVPSAVRAAGGQPVANNADAAAQLASGPKSAPAPVHEAMGGVGPNDPRVGSRDYDSFGRPRTDKSEYDEGSRDMALRSRNGQLGSGMKFRG